MNTLPMTGYRIHKFHPLSVLAQLASRQTTGHLQVSSGLTSWSLYLSKGKLLFATCSIETFDRLDRHLRRLSIQVPTLVSAIRVQTRLLFEKPTENPGQSVADYDAICWLVEQHYLGRDQAALLIEELAKEVLESFLALQEASYELQEQSWNDRPQFCQLDLRPLVELSQMQLRQKQAAGRIVTPLRDSSPAPASTSIASASAPIPALTVEPAPKKWPLAAVGSTRSNAPTPPTPQAKGTFTIACIDDSPTVLQAIHSYLDDKIFTVLMINNPVSALMQIVRSKPDLILLDVTMPNLDGYELCSLLRRHPNFKQTPVIMVTGNTGFIDRAKAKLVGASGYLTKPFTQPDLIKMVFKHLHLM
ncbi:response regulator [Microcoleus sp. FACHB-1515]|uniref:response regulator n=1 Tax=Cyanophyceae TaxID=3028117 RepID=UPI001688EDC8|nr:response regulator [Microcoleus sp. FACHB-1515]MBD2091538.1 response regulator [Microcoleus sp. FACHB-1515]